MVKVFSGSSMLIGSMARTVLVSSSITVLQSSMEKESIVSMEWTINDKVEQANIPGVQEII